ncbi:MAG: cation transporter, partial [Natronomonas sp.]
GTFRRSKDAPLITAATENFVAVVGVVAAILGVYLTEVTGNTVFDAAASAFIGLLLMGFAAALAWENRALLVGEGITRRERTPLLEAIAGTDGVESVVDLRTMHLGPESVLVAVEIDFRDDLDTAGIEATIDDVEATIRAKLPSADRIYVEAESPRSEPEDTTSAAKGEP